MIMLLLLVFFYGTTSSAFAHVLKTNGSVGAVMHVTPDDDPIAGEKSDFYLEFKDTENKFNPKNCDCVITISQSGEEIFSQQLFTNNADSNSSQASFSFTFPKRDIYTITITGKPTRESVFQNFTLSYHVRVQQEADTLKPNTEKAQQPPWFMTHIPHVVLIIIAIVGMTWFLVKKKTRS